MSKFFASSKLFHALSRWANPYSESLKIQNLTSPLKLTHLSRASSQSISCGIVWFLKTLLASFSVVNLWGRYAKSITVNILPLQDIGRSVMGGQVIVGVGINSVPTLSTFFLILLSLMLFVVALRLSKNRGTQFFAMVLSAGLLASTTTNIKNLMDVQASIGSIFLSAPSAGQQEASFSVPNGISTIENTTGSPLQILRIESIASDVCTFNGVSDFCGQRTAPFLMPSGSSCTVECDTPTDISGVSASIVKDPFGDDALNLQGLIDGVDDTLQWIDIHGERAGGGTSEINFQTFSFSGTQNFNVDGTTVTLTIKLVGKDELELIILSEKPTIFTGVINYVVGSSIGLEGVIIDGNNIASVTISFDDGSSDVHYADGIITRTGTHAAGTNYLIAVVDGDGRRSSHFGALF